MDEDTAIRGTQCFFSFCPIAFPTPGLDLAGIQIQRKCACVSQPRAEIQPFSRSQTTGKKTQYPSPSTRLPVIGIKPVPDTSIIKLLFTGFASSLFLSFGTLQSINLMRSKDQLNLFYSKNILFYILFSALIMFTHFFIAHFLLYSFQCWF